MAEPYVGEIRMFAGNFPPQGWAFCNGDLLPIAEYETLFTLIGTTYGGDGQSTFALPDLRSRVPIHQGQGGGLPSYMLGQSGGVETVTLTTATLPAHSHAMAASTANGNSNDPTGNVAASSQNISLYFEDAPAPAVGLNPAAIQPAGGNGPHDNMQPFLAINFIISLFGVYPYPG